LKGRKEEGNQKGIRLFQRILGSSWSTFKGKKVINKVFLRPELMGRNYLIETPWGKRRF